jgi:uncharacterized protein (DUF433 family)
MIAPLQSDPIPLRMDEHGSILVADTQVQLEWVIEAYNQGTTPEMIVSWFERLRLADVHAVIAFYLNHKDEVQQYLIRRDREAEEIRQKIEATQPDRAKLREKLLARQAAMRNAHVPPCE